MTSPNCPNCGAPYKMGYSKCEYCGTLRKMDHPNVEEYTVFRNWEGDALYYEITDKFTRTEILSPNEIRRIAEGLMGATGTIGYY